MCGVTVMDVYTVDAYITDISNKSPGIKLLQCFTSDCIFLLLDLCPIYPWHVLIHLFKKQHCTMYSVEKTRASASSQCKHTLCVYVHTSSCPVSPSSSSSRRRPSHRSENRSSTGGFPVWSTNTSNVNKNVDLWQCGLQLHCRGGVCCGVLWVWGQCHGDWQGRWDLTNYAFHVFYVFRSVLGLQRGHLKSYKRELVLETKIKHSPALQQCVVCHSKNNNLYFQTMYIPSSIFLLYTLFQKRIITLITSKDYISEKTVRILNEPLFVRCSCLRLQISEINVRKKSKFWL